VEECDSTVEWPPEEGVTLSVFSCPIYFYPHPMGGCTRILLPSFSFYSNSKLEYISVDLGGKPVQFSYTV